jgi:hypothetical protein
MRRWTGTGDLLACVVLTALILGCFARQVIQPAALIVDGERPSVDYTQRHDVRPVGNDVTFSFLPRYLHVSETLRRTGKLPQWDDAGFGGRPLVGNPQAGLFYPPVWLAWMVGQPAALGWLTLGHLLWGGLGVYVLTRGLGLGRPAATVAAGCFQVAPYLIAQTVEGHYPHVWAASWYSWAFWSFDQHRRGSLRGTLALPACLALGFLTGHPQEWYYLIFTLSLWAMADAWCAARTSSWGRAARGLLLWGGVLGLALCLAAVESIPDTAALEWSLRSARMTLRQASKYHLHAINLMQLLGPDSLGGPAEFIGDGNYWETLLSLGLVPLVLGTIAVARHPQRMLVRGWAALVLGAVLFAAGHRLGLFPILFKMVPGMDRFRVPARSLFLANLGAAVLSGFGVETLLRYTSGGTSWQSLERSYRRAAAAVLAGLVLIVALDGPFDPDRRPARPALEEIVYGQEPSGPDGHFDHRPGRAASRLLSSGVFWLALGGTAVMLVVGRAAPPRGRAVTAQLLGALALIELALHGHAVVRVTPAEQFLDRDPISTALRTAEQGTSVSGPVRIRARDTLYADIHAFANGIEKVNVNDGFQLQHAADLYQTLYPLLYRSVPPDPGEPMSEAVAQFRREERQAVLDRLSVAFLVSDHIEPEPSWPLVATGVWNGKAFAIHKNPTCLPRAYVVPRAESCPDRASEVLARFRQIDPRQAIVMPHDPLGDAAPGPRQPFTKAAWLSSGADRLVLDVATEAPGLLVVADTWMPGWTAVVDGHPTAILRGNHSQRVIALPDPGSHRVVLRYETPGLARGLMISALALVAWGATVLVAIKGKALHPAVTPIRAACGATTPASAPSRRPAGTASCPRSCARSG